MSYGSAHSPQSTIYWWSLLIKSITLTILTCFLFGKNCSSTMATSTLNPNAPMFVPSEYRQVEDFSDHWWDLVHSSPWFRHYWLCECFSDPEADHDFSDTYDSLLPDTDFIKQEENKKELITLGMLEWNKSRVTAEIPKYGKKVPKIVNVKVSPRHIQQPR